MQISAHPSIDELRRTLHERNVDLACTICGGEKFVREEAALPGAGHVQRYGNYRLQLVCERCPRDELQGEHAASEPVGTRQAGAARGLGLPLQLTYTCISSTMIAPAGASDGLLSSLPVPGSTAPAEAARRA